MKKIDLIAGPGERVSTVARMLTLARWLAGEGAEGKIRLLFPFGIDAEEGQKMADLGEEMHVFPVREDAFTPEGGVHSVLACLQGRESDFFLMPDGGVWRSVAPALAFRMSKGYGAGIRAVRRTGEACLQFGRQTWSGRRMAWLSFPEGAVLTVCAGAFDPSVAAEVPGAVFSLPLATGGARTRFYGEDAGAGVAAGLKEARIILAAGRGAGGPEGLERMAKLGAFLPGSILGGSRPVCDGGWLSYDRQIGETGADVAPELYLACGISGASQHLTGMSRSGTVVVINKDGGAPFFRHADIGVVEDLEGFLDTVLALLGDGAREAGGI